MPSHELPQLDQKEVYVLGPDIPVVIFLVLSDINLCLFLGFLRLQDVKCIIVQFVQIFIIRNNSHNLARLSGSDRAKVNDIVSFGTPRNIVNICKLSTKVRVEKRDKKISDHVPRRR